MNATCEQPREQVVSNAPASKQEEAAVISDLSGVTSFDPWPTFCSGETCSAIVDGQVAYSDASHLNSWGSSQFRDVIANSLRALIGSPAA